MKKDKLIYCTFCGTKNKKKEKICSKCKKELKEKDEELRNYLKGKAKSNVIDKISGGILGTIQLIIQNYFYGIVLSIAIVGTVGVTAINYAEKQKELKEEIKTTIEKYAFEPISVEKRILGAWKNNVENSYCIYVFYADHTGKWVFVNGEKVSKRTFDYILTTDEMGMNKITITYTDAYAYSEASRFYWDSEGILQFEQPPLLEEDFLEPMTYKWELVKIKESDVPDGDWWKINK